MNSNGEPRTWASVEFKEIIQGKPRHGIYKPKEFFGKGVKIIKMGTQSDNAFISEENIPDLIEVDKEELKRYQTFENDLLFLRTSLIMEGTGKCSIIKKLSAPAVFVSNLIAVTLDPNKANSFFYYYFFSSGSGRLKVLSLCEQTAAATIRSSDLQKLGVPYPPLFEQNKIANILYSLDEKIILTLEMNKTLESISQAIFKHWFIDFEFANEKGKPYKSSDGEMVDSELGEIPKGWRVGKFEEIIKITSGKRPNDKSDVKTSEFNIPLIGASSIMGFVKESLYNEPIIVIGRVGTHGIVQRVIYPSFPSDNTLVITSKYYSYSYHVLKMIDYDSLNVGTTQPLITQSTVKNLKIVIPEEKILDKCENITFNIFAKIHQNNFEVETLSSIRDGLLPKLMSGQIRVPIG